MRRRGVRVRVQGCCDERFDGVRAVLAASLERGEDLGASVAVTLDGELVVDLWGGWIDEARTRPWEQDTITNVWSSTKTMTGLAGLVLAAAGELDLDAPVARYWPEFAANGKDRVLVRHLLSHTSGVAGWTQPVHLEDIYDWDRSTAMLADQEPWWEPGTASGYHMMNMGHLVGEVIRRVTGLRLGEFFAREIAAPLGADFHIGLPASEDHRVAPIVPPPPMPPRDTPPDPTSVAFMTATGPSILPSIANTEAWRRADIGAGNGHANARSMALVQSVVSCGGETRGVRLLTPEICDRIFDVQSDGIDLVIGAPSRFGIGYGLPTPWQPHLPSDARICWWGGWGGSLVVNDLDRRMTFAFAMNRMGPSDGTEQRAPDLVRTVYAALGEG